MKLLCKLFGHHWNYYMIMPSDSHILRSCRRCNFIQEFKYYLSEKEKSWIALIMYNPKYAKEHFKEQPQKTI